jgi:hypothetical protein
MNPDTTYWHLTQYVNGEQIMHHVYTDWDYARSQIARKGLWSGTNVLARPSRCECRGRLT